MTAGAPSLLASMIGSSAASVARHHRAPSTSGAPLEPVSGFAGGGLSSMAGGASGVGLLDLLALAGLLLLGAPLAMRRLRLSSEPWRSAPFVLIPERPG
jgi:hypothetical protein